jgi:hypothetical protein
MTSLLASSEEGPLTPYLPEFFLSAQFLSDRCLSGETSGEVALKWAVFVDGLKRYWTMAADATQRRSEEFREEEGWMLADDREWPFSFKNLCETFGLQTESLRAALIAWKQAHLSGAARAGREKKPLRVFPQA